MYRSPRYWFSSYTVLAVFWCCSAASAQLAYVGNPSYDPEGAVSVIDLETGRVTAVFAVGNGPYGIAVTPDGSTIYVAEANAHSVSVFDAVSYRRRASVGLPYPETPMRIVLSPDGTFVYAATRRGVYVIDVATNGVSAAIGVRDVEDIVISPDGRTLYVWGSAGISVIDTESHAVTAIIPAYGMPAITPDGRLLYAPSCPPTDGIYGLPRVCAIDTSSNTVTGMVRYAPDGADRVDPYTLALSPDGRTLCVTYSRNSGSDQAILSLVDTDSGTIRAAVPVGNSAYSIAVSPTGSSVYVVNTGSDFVSVIDTATATVAAIIPVAFFPSGIALAARPGTPVSPLPTRWPTRTPTATAVPTPTPIPIAAVMVRVGSASGRAGERVTVDVTLDTAGFAVAGVQADISFDPQTSIVSCAANPDIRKNRTTFALHFAWLRNLVFDDDSAPIPDGAVLFTCDVDIARGTLSATYSLGISRVVASDPSGNRLPAAGGDGRIVVLPPPSPSPSETVPPTATPTPPPTATARICDANCQRRHPVAYIASFDANAVAVLDTATNTISRSIPLPAGVAPLDIALAPDARAAYVVSIEPGMPGIVSVIDTATNTVTATIALGNEPRPYYRSPHNLAITLDGRLVYATDGVAAVYAIDTSTNAVAATVQLRYPDGVTVSPDGAVYVSSRASDCFNGYGCDGMIAVIDTATQAVTRTIVLRGTPLPTGLALSPDGTFLLVGDANDPISVVDLPTGTVSARIGFAQHVHDIAITADSRTAYALNQYANVSVIDIGAGGELALPISNPTSLALTPDGAWLYVTNAFGEVSVVDTVSNSLVTAVHIDPVPVSMAIGNIEMPVPAAVQRSGGQAFILPASNSTSRDGCSTQANGASQPTAGLLALIAATLVAAGRRRHRAHRRRTGNAAALPR